MRFGPSLALAAAPQLRRGRAGRVVPDGLIPGPQARLDDHAGWTLEGGFEAAPGRVVRGATGTAAKLSYSVPLPAGEVWVAYTITGASAGTIGAELGGGYVGAPFVNKATAQHVARFTTADPHTLVRLAANGSFDGTIEDLQVVDMTTALAQPADIYIAAGQSLMAASGTSGPVDPAKDWWHPRCLYLPGSDNPTYGVSAGVPAACVGPLQMVNTSQGVSPALSFARGIADRTPAGRNVMILACARGSSRLLGSDAEWNPAGDPGTGSGRLLYDNMVAQAQAALALHPESAVRGMLWAQGESDRAPDMDQTYPPAFQAMLSALKADLGLGALPVMLIGPMPDDDDPNQPVFLETQARLDAASGHATAIPGVHHVARPAGTMSGDGTHPTAEGNRIAGRRAARRFLAEGYL